MQDAITQTALLADILHLLITGTYPQGNYTVVMPEKLNTTKSNWRPLMYSIEVAVCVLSNKVIQLRHHKISQISVVLGCSMENVSVKDDPGNIFVYVVIYL